MVAIKKRSFSELQETYMLARAYGDFNEAYKAIAAMKQFVQEAEVDRDSVVKLPLKVRAGRVVAARYTEALGYVWGVGQFDLVVVTQGYEEDSLIIGTRAEGQEHPPPAGREVCPLWGSSQTIRARGTKRAG